MKKNYRAPMVEVQEVQLGVFGDYGDDNNGGGASTRQGGLERRFQLPMD